MIKKLFSLLACALFPLAFAPVALAQAFDHSHAAWTALLKKHVVVINNGRTSQVKYADLAKDGDALKKVSAEYQAVTDAQFKGWSKPQQFAFLANAYNVFTLELILTRYPNLKSIREFGYIPRINSIWDKNLFTLLGKEATLNQIEHQMLRGKGNYEDPRVHYAVNCASVGCPMLGTEALTHDKLDAQLNDLEKRFLSDRSRNRFNESTGQLEVSKIYDWFKEDFNSGWKGVKSSQDYFARFAELLTDNPEHQKTVREGKAAIKYLDYDWSLNDRK
jgi:Protein of unknown function, DUF547